MALKKWHELPVNLRRSEKDRWNYLVDTLGSGEETPEPQEDEFTPISYNFISYADAEGETEWGRGTVETTGETSGNYTEVEVKTNSTDQSFVGQKFFVISSAKTDGTIYTVYTDAGRTSAGFYISISA
ncbi:MAG: hypothetical protein IJI96_02720 [Methanobrevibacter sp.]|nr:hypothetical protein [Methanobrevibacter sp.]MBQ6627420.1 hypothetical protein [Methanobrevibacter sp.]